MRIALLQTCSADSPAANVAPLRAMLREAVAGGAGFVLTPEAVNCISTSRSHQLEVLSVEAEDPVLEMLRAEAVAAGIWVLAGSLLLRSDSDGDERFVNRSLLIAPDGRIVARYDKIHLFDVQVSEAETYRESAGIRPGAEAVLAETEFAPLGLTICYDIRFPQLHRALAQAGARILTVPAAFSPLTGAAHWEVLLRARAIETGAFVLAPAQSGDHPITVGKPRRTHGHSMVVAPWGEVLLDAGSATGVFLLDLDLAEVDHARARVPSLAHDRAFSLSEAGRRP